MLFHSEALLFSITHFSHTQIHTYRQTCTHPPTHTHTQIETDIHTHTHTKHHTNTHKHQTHTTPQTHTHTHTHKYTHSKITSIWLTRPFDSTPPLTARATKGPLAPKHAAGRSEVGPTITGTHWLAADVLSPQPL